MKSFRTLIGNIQSLRKWGGIKDITLQESSEVYSLNDYNEESILFIQNLIGINKTNKKNMKTIAVILGGGLSILLLTSFAIKNDIKSISLNHVKVEKLTSYDIIQTSSEGDLNIG